MEDSTSPRRRSRRREDLAIDPERAILGASLAGLGLALAVLAVRGAWRYRSSRSLPQVAWAFGLAFGAAAMAVEAIVYFGVLTEGLLQAYVFLSAAIVGALSLGSTRVLKRAALERGYAVYTLATLGVVAVASAVVHVPTSIVTGGVISGDPPLLLLLLSIVVTGPATVVLIGSAIVSLRRSWRWQTLLMVAGALVLGAGGIFYIGSFPIVLYYAEFLGIGLLFLGIMSLPTIAPAPHGAAAPAAARP